MTRIARLVLLLVLALAVPFHAAYAVGMAQCAAHKQGAEHAMSHPTQSAPDAQAHCEHGGAPAALPDTEENKPAATATHCGACSACGTSIAIAGGLSSTFAAAPARAHLSLPVARLDGVTPSRLDRPPLPL
jgi:hypothetical protein